LVSNLRRVGEVKAKKRKKKRIFCQAEFHNFAQNNQVSPHNEGLRAYYR